MAEFVTLLKRATTALLVFLSGGLQEISAQTTTERERTIEIEAVSIKYFNPSKSGIRLAAEDSLGSSVGSTVEGILSLMPQTDIRSRGAWGAQADLSIRGGSNDQSSVMLNGIDFTDPRTGHQSLSLPVDIELVGRIDLVAASGLSGGIDITAREYDRIRAEVTAGAHGYLYSGIAAGGINGSTRLFGAASLRRSDGYRPNTDFLRNNLYMNLEGNYRIGRIAVQAGYQSNAWGSNGFYSLLYPDQYEETRTGLASVRWSRVSGRMALGAYASFRKNDDMFELFRGNVNAPEWYAGPNYHTTDNAGAGAACSFDWSAGRSDLSADYVCNHIFSNVLGIALDSPRRIAGIDGLYTHGAERHRTALRLAHRIEAGRAFLSGSAGGELTSMGVYPLFSAVAGYESGNGFTAELSVIGSMRLPTFTDLYYTTATHIGNPELKAEEATTYSWRVQRSSKALSASLSAYYRRGRNIIDWVKLPGDPRWTSSRLTRLDTFGVEFTALYVSSGPLREAAIRYGFCHTDKSIERGISKYALDYMRNKISVSAVSSILPNLFLSADATLYDRNGRYELSEGEAESFKPHTLVNARLTWQRDMVRFHIDARNIFSASWFDFGGIPQPERWLSAGIAITL